MTTTPDRQKQNDPLIGTVFAGRYKIERRLGRGGMGVVYRAFQSDANRKVVLKVLAPDWIGDPEALARFEREARGLSALQHPNIVAIHDYGSFDGRAYIVMEYVAGETLERFVKRKGHLTLADFVPVAAQVLKGLGEAHSRGIIHRDIKPANIMLCERQGRANYVKILDFGLAKLVSGSSDITKQNVMGTPTCLSPEQIKGEKLDQRVDVYAVGILFYYMLAGRPPFAAESDASILYKHVHEKPEPLVRVLPADHQVPEGVLDLIGRCLEKSPAKRPRDANEVVEGLIDQVPFSMFKLPRAEPRPAGEEDLDEPYEDPTGEMSGEALPGPQDIQVGNFPRPEPGASSGPIAAAAVAAAAAPVMVSRTGPIQPLPPGMQPALQPGMQPGLNPAAITGAHSAMSPGMNPMMTYPPGVLPRIEAPVPERPNNGIVYVAALAIVVLGVFGYFVLFGNKPPQGAGTTADVTATNDAARLQQVIDRADGLIDRKQYGQAQILLDNSAADFARYPDLLEQVAARKDQIEIGRLLESGRAYEEAGDRDAALKAYRDILARNSRHVEARDRVAALSGSPPGAALGWLSARSEPAGGELFIDDAAAPVGTTPLDAQPLPAGFHQITIQREGYLPWRKSVTIEANKTLPINAELTPRPTKPATTRPATTKPPTTKPPTTTKPPATTTTTPSKPEPKPKPPMIDDDGLMPVGKKK